MLPEIGIKESSVVQTKIKEPIQTKNSKGTQSPSHAASHRNLRSNSRKREYKFFNTKPTEETDTGFPSLPATLKPRCKNISSTVIESRKLCRISHQKLPESVDTSLICSSNSTVKKRRSSGVSIPKRVKNRNRGRKGCSKILLYKTKVSYSPLFDLGTLCKTDFLSTNKQILSAKQSDTQNKAEEPLMFSIHEEHSQQQMNSNHKNTFSISLSSECDKTSQDAARTSSDADSNILSFQNNKDVDDQSLFLANLGLKRKVAQKEVAVNCSDQKFVNAEISNNAEAKNTVDVNEISMGINLEAHHKHVEESTKKTGPDMSSNSMNLEEVRHKVFKKIIHEHNYSKPENTEHSQEGKYEVNTSSEKNTEYTDDVQPSSQAADLSKLRNHSHKREYKFYTIKSTEQTKTGFPILPTALKHFINNSSNNINSTKSF